MLKTRILADTSLITTIMVMRESVLEMCYEIPYEMAAYKTNLI
jgi:hypothetical protein